MKNKTKVGQPLYRRRFTPKMLVGLFIWVAAALLIVVGIKNFRFIFPRASTDAVPFQVTVGEEEIMMGPTDQFADTFFNTVKTANGVVAFTGGGSATKRGSTYRFTGTNLSNLRANPAAPVLTVNPPGSWDECGTWLNSVYKVDEQHWVGWYHGERTGGDPANGYKKDHFCWFSIKSMGFVESFDGGVTWTKSTNGQPTNQVITGEAGLPDDKLSYGDAKVMKIGNFFYMFITAPNSYTTEIARSKVSDLGKPGTWKKYYNGGFTENGIGGKSSVVDPDLHFAQGFLSYNSYLNRYIAIRARGRDGFYLSYTPYKTDDTTILNWERFPVDLIPPVSSDTDPSIDKWQIEGTDRGQIYTYASIIGADGDPDKSGQQFYLYYMKVYEGDSLATQRYLMRRKITLEKSPKDAFPAKIMLMQYERPNGKQDFRAGIDVPRPSDGYVKKQPIGYILPYPEANTKELHDCYIGIWNEYMLTRMDPSSAALKNCHSDGEKHIRRVGWVLGAPTTTATQPLYLCWNESRTDHYASRYKDCRYGGGTSTLAGYLIPDPSQPQVDSAVTSPTPKVATPTPVAGPTKEQLLTQQFYREMIGTVPALTDPGFVANVEKVRKNDCLGAVKAIAQRTPFLQRKRDYTDLQYVMMMHRTIVSRNPDPANATNGWVKELAGGHTSRDALITKLYSFPEPQAACQERRLIK